MKTVKRRGALLVGVAAAVVALDQWTKSWAQGALAGGPVHVLGPVNLGLVYNKGAAFSFGTGASPVIAAVAVPLGISGARNKPVVLMGDSLIAEAAPAISTYFDGLGYSVHSAAVPGSGLLDTQTAGWPRAGG